MTAIETDGSRAIAASSDGVYESVDGGRTWVSRDDAEPPTRLDQSACVSTGSCFELVDDSVIESASNGSEIVAFEFTEQDRRAMRRNSEGCGDADPADGFAAITAVDQPQGEHIIVTMRSQGVVVRTPAGEWERHSVGYSEPISTDGFTVAPWWRLGLLAPPILVLLSVVLAHENRKRGGRRSAVVVTAVVVATTSVLVAIPLLASRTGASWARGFRAWSISMMVVAAVASLALSLYVRRQRRALPPPQTGPWGQYR